MAYGNFRGNSGFRGNRSGGFRRNFHREMTKIKCAECGKEDEVPFKPRDGSTVLCKDCYMKKKGITPRNREAGPEEEQEEIAEESEEDSGLKEEKESGSEEVEEE